MLLGSSLHLLPPVLVTPSPSGALLLGAGMGSLSGQWVGAVSVPLNTDQEPLLFVAASQLYLRLDLEQMVLFSHRD